MKSSNHITRRKTRQIMVGNVPVGGDAPISVQTMTNTETTDVPATLEQIGRMENAGVDIIRVSVPSMDAAEAFKQIREQVAVPLVADIHFTPNAAEVAARIVEKVRVNPGNYADRKKFKNIEYTDESYQEELQLIHMPF